VSRASNMFKWGSLSRRCSDGSLQCVNRPLRRLPVFVFAPQRRKVAPDIVKVPFGCRMGRRDFSDSVSDPQGHDRSSPFHPQEPRRTSKKVPLEWRSLTTDLELAKVKLRQTDANGSLPRLNSAPFDCASLLAPCDAATRWRAPLGFQGNRAAVNPVLQSLVQSAAWCTATANCCYAASDALVFLCVFVSWWPCFHSNP
jgi:hypothetical protein